MQQGSLLDRVYIANPCPANWDEMAGDDRVRFCAQCQLHVYNLSEMTRGEAESLLRQSEGRLCTKLYRRADGTVVTRDCAYGLRAITRRAAVAYAFVVGFCVRATAQEATGSIEGVITDATGAGIVSARARLTDPSSGQSRTSKADEKGIVRLAGVIPGRYLLRIEALGFRSHSKDDLVVRADQVSRVDARLEIGSVGGSALGPLNRHNVAADVASRLVRWFGA